MASPILIQATLEEADINRAFGNLEKRGKKAFDAINSYAQQTTKILTNALGAGSGTQGFSQAQQRLAQIQQQFANQQVLIAQRAAAQQATITQRANAQQVSSAQQAATQQQVIAQQNAARLQQINAQAAAKQAAIAQQAAAQQAAIQARAAIQQQAQQQRLAQVAATGSGALAFLKRYSSTVREAGESIQQAGYGLTALTGGILSVGRAAVRSAVDIDSQVNVLKALTGSAETAEKRFKALVALSGRTPGLTTSLAATLDAQLRVARVSEASIDKILPVIGRLNAVSPLGNPQQFAANLTQLFTQNFERQDLKELIGNSPLAGQIIAELFNVDSPTNAKAIRESPRRAAIKSADEFFAAFADAAAKNKGLANVTESLGTQFDKLRDRALVALRPLGLEIIKTLTPVVERLVPLIEELAAKFAALDPSTKTAILAVAGIAAALGPAVFLLGGFIQAFGAFGNLVTVFAGASGLGGAGAALGVFGGVLAGAVVEVKALYDAYQSNIGGIRDLVSEFVAAATKFWATYGDFIKGTASGIWEFVKIVTASGLGAVLQVITGILQTINGDWRKGLGNLLEGTKKVLSGLPGIMSEIGKNAIAGLIEGAKSKSEEVKNIFTTMARIAIQASQATFVTKSPSKVFNQIGQDVGDGLIQGIQVKQSDISKASKELAQESIKGARSAVADLQALLDASPQTLQARAAEQNAREFIRVLEEILDIRRQLGQPVGDALPQTIQAARIEADRLAASLTAVRDKARGIIKFPEVAKLEDFVRLSSPLAGSIPGGEIPTPQKLKDAITAASNIPSAPFAEATGFAKGFFDQIESGDQIFERFGQSVSRSLLNVKDLFANLAASVKNLFFDILGNGLQRLVGGALGSLFGGGANSGAAGAAGGGGFSLKNIFGGLFGGGSGGGGLFRTPSFNPSASGGGGNFFSQLAGLNFGISAPASLTNGGLPSIAGVTIPSLSSAARNGININGTLAGGSLLSGLFNGIGFGKAPGSGGALAGLLPLLGVSLGSGLGGSSRFGSIIGGIGGGLLGVGLTAAPAIIGAGGAASGLGFLAPLFSNPATAIAGGVALLGAFLLGRAAKRKKDEATSGEYLTEAIARIRDLTAAAEAGKLTSVGEARKIFESDILATFISQINTIKTASVRNSRLKNQVPDLRNLFEKEVVPAVVAANKAQGRFSNQLPEFHTGILASHETYAKVLKNEMVLTQAHQAGIKAIAGFDVFRAVGVPGTIGQQQDGTPIAHTGGINSTPAGGSPTFVFENLVVTVGEGDATRILEAAVRTPDGKRYIYQTNKDVTRNGGI